MHEFAHRAGLRWDPTLQYASARLQKEIPGGVKVNGHPRVSGIFDTMNCALVHGVQLPKPLYDEQIQKDLEGAIVEEWFAGYRDSAEFRRLGIGSFLGDILDKMDDSSGRHDEKGVKLAMYGSHDTQLASILASLQTFDGRWPCFTSSIAFELFSRPSQSPLGATWKGADYFVRMMYNDKALVIPACKAKANHLDGNESFCTLDAFRQVVEQMRPKDWKQECRLVSEELS